MTVTRTHYVLLGTGLLLLLIGLAHQHNQMRETIQNAWSRPSSSQPAPVISESSFAGTIPPPIPVPNKPQTSSEKTSPSPPSKE